MLITTDRPTAFQVAGRAWRSTFSAMRQMAPLFLSCLAALLAITFASQWLTHNPSPLLTPDQVAWLKHPSGLLPPWFWRTFPGTVFWELVDAIILAPVAIAVHRFILLGEIRKGVIFVSPVTLRFAALATVFAVLQMILGVIHPALSPLTRAVVDIAYWSCVIWTLMAFPSIAVEEPFGNMARRLDAAVGRVKGNFWLVVRTMLITVLLVVLMIGVYETAPFFMDPEAFKDPATIIATTMERYNSWPFKIAMTVAIVLMTALGAAAASWIYSYAISKEEYRSFD